MIKKIYSPQRRICQVYFRIEPQTVAQSISKNTLIETSNSQTQSNLMCILACFTDWKPIPMKHRPDGSYSVVYTLEGSKRYQFRYLYDKAFWVEEPDCDGTEANPFGSENCVLET
jgi:hypothetical protein